MPDTTLTTEEEIKDRWSSDLLTIFTGLEALAENYSWCGAYDRAIQSAVESMTVPPPSRRIRFTGLTEVRSNSWRLGDAKSYLRHQAPDWVEDVIEIDVRPIEFPVGNTPEELLNIWRLDIERISGILNRAVHGDSKEPEWREYLDDTNPYLHFRLTPPPDREVEYTITLTYTGTIEVPWDETGDSMEDIIRENLDIDMGDTSEESLEWQFTS